MLPGIWRFALSGTDRVSVHLAQVQVIAIKVDNPGLTNRSQTWRNVLASSARNATVSIGSNADPLIPDTRHLEQNSSHWQHDRPQWRRGMPSKGRATLFGHFELTNATTDPESSRRMSQCYLHHHPDASHWAPGSKASPHVPFWATFVVNRVYWVGGFGDEHYIGWFDQSDWNNAWKSSPVQSPEKLSLGVGSPSLHTASDYQLLFGITEQADSRSDQLVFQ